MSNWELGAAQEFDRWQLSGRADGMAEGHRHGTEAILNQWSLNSESRILDVGCGQGWLVHQLCKAGIALGVGVDISEEMIGHARRFASDHSQFLVSSASELPFKENFFSHVISIESLYYHTRPVDSLAEWHRITQVGGVLGVMVDLYGENKGSHAWVDALNIPVHLFSISDYLSLFEQAGWGNVRFQQIVDPRPVKPESDFVPTDYYPCYDDYCAFRHSGSLILTAEKLA